MQDVMNKDAVEDVVVMGPYKPIIIGSEMEHL